MTLAIMWLTVKMQVKQPMRGKMLIVMGMELQILKKLLMKQIQMMYVLISLLRKQF